MNCFLKTAPMNHFDLFFFGLAVELLALDIGLEKDKSHLLLSDEDMLALGFIFKCTWPTRPYSTHS